MSSFVTYPHAALSQKANVRPVDDTMRKAGGSLLEAATAAQAYGLAAAHLGLAEPVVVISVATDPSQRDYRLLFNPEVIAVSTETQSGNEGSVSMPGIEVSVTRAVWADITYDDANGMRQTERFDGFVARVAQHEIDQMNGIFFLRRISTLKRDAAIRKFQKNQRLG